MRPWKVPLAALAALAAPLGAEPAQPVPDPGEIVVPGQREIDRAIVTENLEELIQRIRVFKVVPRYFQPLCLHIAGPDVGVAQAMGERILSVASQVGLDRPSPDCRTNAMVLITDQPERLYEKLVQSRRDIVGSMDQDVHFRRLRDDIRSGRPAIVWNRTKLVEDGAFDYVEVGGPVISLRNDATRTFGSVYRSKLLSVVMLDSRKIAAATPTQLADYAAMHLLGSPKRQIDFDAVSARSILGLFLDDPELAPQELTAFDLAYLKGVYATGRNGLRGKVTRAILASYEAQCADPEAECQFVVQPTEQASGARD